MKSLADALVNEPDEVEFDTQILGDALRDSEQGPLVAALLIDSPSLRERAGEHLRLVPDPSSEAASRWIAVACLLEEDSVDDEIDAWIADADRAPVAIEGLLRADIDWYHPALADYLDHDDETAAFGAASLLVRADAQQFEEALIDVEDTDDVVAALRAASLSAAPEWFASLREWRDHLFDDADQRDRDRLDAALGCVAPDLYARAVLMGDISDHWLGDDRPVADFITRQGPTTWTSSLAVFREVRNREAFELCAAFATCAAFTEPFDDLDEDRLDPGDAARFISDDPSRIAYPLAISDEDELAELLIEATLHEALLRRDVQPPAITGLPLSGPAPKDADEISDRFSIFDDLDIGDPRHLVALVRSLTDLIDLVRRGVVAKNKARPVLEHFSEAAQSTARLCRAFVADEPLGRAGDWGCRGIQALLWQLHRPAELALPELSTGWFTGPIERAPLYRSTFGALR